jgi:hypothetical protein
MAIATNLRGATLPALVVPNSGAASVYFQYGRTAAYGSQTATQQAGGVNPTQVLIKVSGLRPRTIYHYRVVAVTPDGSAIGADETFTTSPTPVVSGLKLSPRTFRVPLRQPARARTTIRYADSRAATTTLVVMECVRSRRGKCTRYVRIGSFKHVDAEGANQIRWAGRLRGRALLPGGYMLKATPQAGRKRGRTVSATFRVRL